MWEELKEMEEEMEGGKWRKRETLIAMRLACDFYTRFGSSNCFAFYLHEGSI